MAATIWKLLLVTTQVSSARQCSAPETCGDDQSSLLQSHVTSHKSSVGLALEETQHLVQSFPRMSALNDPKQRKMALSQFEETALELASNRMTVTPTVVTVCNDTANLLREMVMTAIIREHDTDVAMLASTYAVFDELEQQRLHYEQLILSAVDAVYGSGGLKEVHTQCRVTESQTCEGCGICTDTCQEIIERCEIHEVTLRLRLEEVITTVDRDAYCDDHFNIVPASQENHVTLIEHYENKEAFEAYIAALDALEDCEVSRTTVCHECVEEEPTSGASLLALGRHRRFDWEIPPDDLVILPDPDDNELCRNHTSIRVECNNVQVQLQAAACDARHLTSNYLSLYEAAFLAAAARYDQIKATIMIMEADRKVEWVTLERVICLLLSLTNDEDGSASSAETADLINGCQYDFVDDSHLNIVYLPTPVMGTLPSVPLDPCSDEFADEVYGGLLECEGNAEFQERYDHGVLTDCTCQAPAPEQIHYGFPYELGPYLLFDTGFENLNSAAGFQVNGAGSEWTATVEGALYTGRLSAFVAVTLPDLDAAFGLEDPDESVAEVAWAYGDPQGTTDMVMHGEDYPETIQHRFVRTGGYVYRNSLGFVVALKEIAPSSDSLGQDAQLTLFFGEPQDVAEPLALEACPQMGPVTFGRLQDAGAQEYCWYFADAIPFCDHGCFLFRTHEDRFLAFAVSEAPEEPPAVEVALPPPVDTER